MKVDAIVNSANKKLLGSSGVDNAIHKAAGVALLEEYRKLNGCEVGEAKITAAYKIQQVKSIIHVVGPKVAGEVTDQDRTLLANCYKNALNLAKKNQLRTIAFPCVSTGIYSFPNEAAARISLEAVKKWLNAYENASAIDSIVFCVFEQKNEEIYKKLIAEIFQ